MRQFPPPGLDAGDSFFAVDRAAGREGRPALRRAMAPGTSQSTLMIRAYAALLQGVADVEAPPTRSRPVLDPGRLLQQPACPRRRPHPGAGRRPRADAASSRADDEPRELDRNIELTSREPSSDIPGHLEALAVEHPDEEALDYVLATNMISVGVDIDRLGLMVVMGQPQATAEYIQATSRVGRQHPGLVLTLYNAGRSRDRSHYESFPTYHAALYRQVESTSVTPFSPRARDRALHAVLLALARTAVPALRDNDAARDVEQHLAELRAFADAIAERAEQVEPGTGAAVREEFERVLERWVARSQRGTEARVRQSPGRGQLAARRPPTRPRARASRRRARCATSIARATSTW